MDCIASTIELVYTVEILCIIALFALLIVPVVLIIWLIPEDSIGRERQLYAHRRLQDERVRIAIGLVSGYCRRWLLDTETSLVSKDEVVSQLTSILNALGKESHTETANKEKPRADSTSDSRIGCESDVRRMVPGGG